MEKNWIYKNKKEMKKQVIENFEEWIFEAATPGVPAGYSKSTITGEEKRTIDEIKSASGWKALKNDYYLQVSNLKFETAGVASDKVEDFKGKGELVMGPTIYGNSQGSSFIVGFPFSKFSIESKEIYLTDKYLLFVPFDGTTPNFTADQKTGASLQKPTNARLVDKDKLFLVGLQSLTWILGFNNAEAGKKAFSTMSREDIIKTFKSGLESLSKVSRVASFNDSAEIILKGYNSILTNEKSAEILFNTFASTHTPKGGESKITAEDIRKELGLKGNS